MYFEVIKMTLTPQSAFIDCVSLGGIALIPGVYQ